MTAMPSRISRLISSTIRGLGRALTTLRTFVAAPRSLATGRKAVADAEVETSQEDAAEARRGAPGSPLLYGRRRQGFSAHAR
jgi:hypothetical protein